MKKFDYILKQSRKNLWEVGFPENTGFSSKYYLPAERIKAQKARTQWGHTRLCFFLKKMRTQLGKMSQFFWQIAVNLHRKI